VVDFGHAQRIVEVLSKLIEKVKTGKEKKL